MPPATPKPQPSHRYDFNAVELAARIAMRVVPLVVFAAAMHLGARWGWLPDSRPTLDVDRTILLHQAEASGKKQDANLVLIGDSSCLMDVSAEQLQSLLPEDFRTLNLGTLSYLGWSDYAMLLQRYVVANPGRVKAVVLLMHPEALRRSSPVEYHVDLLHSFLDGRDFSDPTVSALSRWSGGEILKSRVVSRALPQSLPGAYGRYYGFSTDLWNYLSAHRGSAIDPRTFDPATAEGNAEYSLSGRLQASSKTFREAVPPGIKLFVGITPAPSTFVLPGYAQGHEQMLRAWSTWLNADVALSTLPATLPSEQFASVTHLTAEGRVRYTALLASALRNALLSQN